MAKDDFDYIAFKILSYYYACLKGKASFDEKVFLKIIKGIEEGYFLMVLRSLCEDGYIEGLVFIKAWGSTYVLANDLVNGSITEAGINYFLNDPPKMVHRSTRSGKRQNRIC